MQKINQFLMRLKEKLERQPQFTTWKHLEKLTAQCANELILDNPDYHTWTVEYDEDTHKFPDVIITTDDGKFGVEVKSSQSKNWETLGGSIQESTKVKGLTHIFILFGKNINNNIHVKIKEFSQCIKGVAVTHSPRYLIDMNLETGEDIFTQLNTSYTAVCASQFPFKIFKDYFKEKARKSNTQFWFLSENEDERTSEKYQELEWKFFNQLTPQEKISLICEAIILYPVDLFGSKKTNYDHCNVFFLSRNIISNSMRDNFTAGGQFDLHGIKVPQKYSLLVNQDYLKCINQLLTDIPTIEMKQIYNTEDISEIRTQWLNQIRHALNQTIPECSVCAFIINEIKQNI